jgi:hypothetical protein
MTVLLTLHSITRWLVTLAALALIIRLVLGLVKKQAFDKGTSTLLSAFNGLMDTQALLGILFFVFSGMGEAGFPRYRWEHAVTMLVATIVAHLPAMWKKKDDSTRTRNTLIAVCFALLLVFLGVSSIGGWTRWWHISGLF